MKKEKYLCRIFIYIIGTINAFAGEQSNLQLDWKGYWPGINTENQESQITNNSSTSTLNQPAIQNQVLPQTFSPMVGQPQRMAAVPQQAPLAQRIISLQEGDDNIAGKQKRQITNVQTAAGIQNASQPVTKTNISTPAAVATAATQPAASQGAGAAMAGIGAAFAALGSMGASAQKSQPSQLNPYGMMPGRTATERFNCVGKPPQQCQQDWDNLVRRIESMPGARIINKNYGCGPAAMGMMQPGMMNPAALGMVNPGMMHPAAMGMTHPGMTHPGMMNPAGMGMMHPAAMGVMHPGMVHTQPTGVSGAVRGLAGLLHR